MVLALSALVASASPYGRCPRANGPGRVARPFAVRRATADASPIHISAPLPPSFVLKAQGAQGCMRFFL